MRSDPMPALTGKRALVTGSTQGIGLAVARRLAAGGCDIILHGLGDPDASAALQRDIETDSGCRTLYSSADLRNPSAIERMMATALEAFGGIDILVNNAVTRHVAPIESMTPEQWNEDLAVNLSAAFHTIRLALPGMKTRNWGRIVNVSSIYGLVGAANRAGYVTTKTALIGLTRAVALETTGHDITCNAVCPGTSATPIHEASIATLRQGQALERDAAERVLLAGKQPTGRLIAPEGIAALIVSLCGPESRDITGAAIPIDGGWSAM
ncbi:MAG TPA: SDR family NAD(P)-dependent oxidoreductase [Terriglobia bacterium]|nr:SDR family NAD(P)-dependent oxidoreductase [Terriglobia bacterium]